MNNIKGEHNIHLTQTINIEHRRQKTTQKHEKTTVGQTKNLFTNIFGDHNKAYSFF